MILVLSILFTSILVLGAKIVTHEEMALNSLLVLATNKKSKWFEALLICAWCMPSIWSIFGYAFANLYLGFTWNIAKCNLVFYPIIVGAASVISGITWTLILYFIELLNSIKMKNEIFKLEHYDQEK